MKLELLAVANPDSEFWVSIFDDISKLNGCRIDTTGVEEVALPSREGEAWQPLT
jgi:hypothetical protein